MTSPQFCQWCGRPLPPMARFCSDCGRNLTLQTVPYRRVIGTAWTRTVHSKVARSTFVVIAVIATISGVAMAVVALGLENNRTVGAIFGRFIMLPLIVGGVGLIVNMFRKGK